MILFRDQRHRDDYGSLLWRMQGEDYDENHAAFAYLVTLDVVCRAHIGDLYDCDNDCIRPEALNASWQTGSSIKTTRLAFNLFTDNTAWTENPELVAPVELFCCPNASFYLEALRIRFSNYICAFDFVRDIDEGKS